MVESLAVLAVAVLGMVVTGTLMVLPGGRSGPLGSDRIVCGTCRASGVPIVLRIRRRQESSSNLRLACPHCGSTNWRMSVSMK